MSAACRFLRTCLSTVTIILPADLAGADLRTEAFVTYPATPGSHNMLWHAKRVRGASPRCSRLMQGKHYLRRAYESVPKLFVHPQYWLQGLVYSAYKLAGTVLG